MLNILQEKINYALFTRKDQQSFVEDVSELIEDGVPAHAAVAAMAEIASGLKKEVATSILKKIGEGQSMADGMAGWFPLPIVEIIRAGEIGGSLPENMKAAARALSQQSNAIADLISATAYPIAVLVAGMFVTVYIKNTVFSNFKQIKPVEQWPENGQTLYHLAVFIENGWWMMLIAVIAGAFLFAKTLRHFSGHLRRMADKIPVFSLYRDVMAARFMETMGLLLVNGMVLKKALEVVSVKTTPYLSWHYEMMKFRLSGGRDNIAEVLDTGLISDDDILRLKVIAKGKGFEHALVRLGFLSHNRNAKRIKLTARVIGGILLFLGASLLAYMIFAIYGVGSFVGT